MAASSMKDIKLRIKSVESTMQITKAMELVASSKLRRAKERAESTRPYFTILHQTLEDIAHSNTDFSSPFVREGEVGKACYVVIAGDRGLAGGYNNNLFKAVWEDMDTRSVCALPIGKKAVEYCARPRWRTSPCGTAFPLPGCCATGSVKGPLTPFMWATPGSSPC